MLIANRGEIAVRVARTCHEMGLSTVAVFSDADAAALHTRSCDEAVHIGPGPAAESYLNVPALLEAASRSGADAVHPGYGFLSENPEFAQAVLDAGLVWIGPSPESIRLMGKKTAARERMQQAGVPVVPGSHDPADAQSVGFPLLVKADAGGGGRGMRLVRSADGLDAAVASAQREAGSAFGSEKVFIERYIEQGRHIEVQVFGDQQGRVIHLGERECSVQRRHQKVVEESPSVAVDPALRERLGRAAVAAAKAVDYQGAGTVEFLLDDDGSFYFLEMNTRLQVEHPVTECVTGLDLVRLQLQVALGQSLPEQVSLTGAAIEVRLYAEDPANDYQPQTGTLVDFHLPMGAGVRLDTGVEEGSVVGIHYDPMLAKLIATGPDREEARRRLLRALSQLSVLGVQTNIGQLQAILSHADFVSGAVHTRWLEQEQVTGEAREGCTQLAALAALSLELESPRPLLPGVSRGWRNSRYRDAELSVSGEVLGWRAASSGWRVSFRGETLLVRVLSQNSAERVLDVNGHRRTVRVVATQDGWAVHTPQGIEQLVRDPVFPDLDQEEAGGGGVCTTPGRVLRVDVQVGDQVEEGQVLLVLEAMKMEHSLRAAKAGRVAELRVQVGEQVEAGAQLVLFEEAGE